MNIKIGEKNMKIHYAEILMSTLTFLLIIVAIKILLFIHHFTSF